MRWVWRDNSQRHRSGSAVDVVSPRFQGGLTLDERFRRTAAIFREAGATGFGVYQQGPSMGMVHANLYPTRAVWGHNGRSATAPGWLRRMF